MNTKEINVKTEEMLDKYYIVGLENGRGPSKAFRKKKKKCWQLNLSPVSLLQGLLTSRSKVRMCII